MWLSIPKKASIIESSDIKTVSIRIAKKTKVSIIPKILLYF